MNQLGSIFSENFLLNFWFEELKKSWKAYEPDVRILLFKRFKNSIRKHDLDPRYSQKDRSTIADFYLNFISLVSPFSILSITNLQTIQNDLFNLDSKN